MNTDGTSPPCSESMTSEKHDPIGAPAQPDQTQRSQITKSPDNNRLQRTVRCAARR